MTSTDQGVFLPANLRALAREVVGLLASRNETVSVAETAAGGLVSASLLATPGASKIYKGGLTLYTLESRIAFAGWTPEHLKSYSGPTPEIVAGLASNVRGKLGSTYTVSESGTAGPTGGSTRNRTPGYVALAVDGPSGTVTAEVETGHGNREANMVEFTLAVLNLLKQTIEGKARI
ncbi:hypothetical protein SLS62_009892 [Diatrype stigma]|uniref:CinA C-terminal domain-containing protein n=1 Tax=Diatrype stigma TaxID=117547 RepID=A0AAN9UBG2_9PEZI